MPLTRPADAAELARKALAADFAGASGLCQEWMHDLSAHQMRNPALPHVECRAGRMLGRSEGRGGPLCLPHDDDRIEPMGEALLPESMLTQKDAARRLAGCN